jgi:hypothetical protein
MGYAQTKNAGSIGSTFGFSYIPTLQSNILTYTSPTLAGTPYQPTANEATAGESNTVAALITAFVSSTAINNSISLQQANFNVQAASSGSVAGVLQAASGGSTSDILDLKNGGGALVASFGSTGNVALQASTNSATAFQVQNASGATILYTDTTANTLDLNGNVNLNQVAAPTAALTAASGSGGSLSGTFYYVVTYVTASGDTSYGPVSSSVGPVTSKQINLTSIPISPSNLVTARRIYRGTSSGGPFNLVWTISDNVTTSYADNITVLGAAASSINQTAKLELNGSFIVRKIILTPEYAGAVLDNGGAGNDIGTMIAGFDSTQRESYYQWTTAQSANQVYDVVVQLPLPSDFISWASTTPITVDVKTSDITNGITTAKLTDTTGTLETNWNTCSLTPSNNSWNTMTGCTVSGTYNANGIITLRLILQAPPNAGSSETEIGNISLTYNSAY